MLAGCIRDRRDPALITYTLAGMMCFRMFAIACGYEDGDDCDSLSADPLFKLVVGKVPESGRDLCSQPTMSRLENMPSRIEAARMTAALVDTFCQSFPAPRRDHPGYRRHLRSGARRSATFVVPRPLRHQLLPAHPRLPCRERQADGGVPAPGQDTVGRRGPHRPQASGPPHPPALAWHPHRLPGSFPLRPPGGHGLVRGKRCRLHLRPVR